jgi:TonB family protein
MRRRPWAAALIVLMLSACSADMSAAPAGAEKQPARPEAGDPYLNLLRDRVVKYLPKEDEDSGKLTATYVVGLYRDGRLASVQIRRSSGNDRIDSAGVSAIRRASPMPPVPSEFPGDPIVYFTASLSIRPF